MTPALQQQLYDRYPDLFREKDLPMSQTCMCWGIETGDGWATLLDAMCAALSTESWSGSISIDMDEQREGDEPYWQYELPQVVCHQCKTKMATLRFYYHTEYSPEFEAMAVRFPKTAAKLRERLEGYIDGAVAVADSLSSRTCEDTGKPGTLHSKGGSRYGWLMTLCPERAAELGYKAYEPQLSQSKP